MKFALYLIPTRSQRGQSKNQVEFLLACKRQTLSPIGGIISCQVTAPGYCTISPTEHK